MPSTGSVAQGEILTWLAVPSIPKVPINVHLLVHHMRLGRYSGRLTAWTVLGWVADGWMHRKAYAQIQVSWSIQTGTDIVSDVGACGNWNGTIFRGINKGSESSISLHQAFKLTWIPDNGIRRGFRVHSNDSYFPESVAYKISCCSLNCCLTRWPWQV